VSVPKRTYRCNDSSRISDQCGEDEAPFAHDPFRFAAFNFAILIARTFFMIRRRVALSAALRVVLAIAEVNSAVQFANTNLYFRSVVERQNFTRVALRKKYGVCGLDGFPQSRDFVDDSLQVVDNVPDGVQNLYDYHYSVDDCDGESYACRSFRNFCRAAELKLRGNRFEEVNDASARCERTLDELCDFCNCTLDVDDALSESEVFAEVFKL
jgi:hypothetical protein